MFQTVPLYIIRILFTVHSAMLYVVQLSETRRVSCQNNFVKLVRLVGFSIKKKDCADILCVCAVYCTVYVYGI